MTTPNLNHQLRLAEQTSSIHFGYGHELRNKALLADSTAIALSAITLSFTFGNELIATRLPEVIVWAEISIALFCLLAFVVTIFKMVFDWAGRSRVHLDAGEKWSSVVRLARSIRLNEEGDLRELEALVFKEYWKVANSVPSIPDDSFIRLKAKYEMRNLERNQLSENPGLPLFLIRFQIRWTSLKQALDWHG